MKHVYKFVMDKPSTVSPGLIAGGGLKLVNEPPKRPRDHVSPGLIAGGGLKQRRADRHGPPAAFPPASSPGAD